jgi:hypothetical protein
VQSRSVSLQGVNAATIVVVNNITIAEKAIEAAIIVSHSRLLGITAHLYANVELPSFYAVGGESSIPDISKKCTFLIRRCRTIRRLSR